MKKMVKNGKFKFVADVLIPDYKKAGWLVEGENAAPPQEDPKEDKTAPEGTDAQAEAVFTCPVCGKEYKTEANLEKHMAKEHPEA